MPGGWSLGLLVSHSVPFVQDADALSLHRGLPGTAVEVGMDALGPAAVSMLYMSLCKSQGRVGPRLRAATMGVRPRQRNASASAMASSGWGAQTGATGGCCAPTRCAPAHLIGDIFAVSPGQALGTGAGLCSVGDTGDTQDKVYYIGLGRACWVHESMLSMTKTDRCWCQGCYWQALLDS